MSVIWHLGKLHLQTQKKPQSHPHRGKHPLQTQTRITPLTIVNNWESTEGVKRFPTCHTMSVKLSYLSVSKLQVLPFIVEIVGL